MVQECSAIWSIYQIQERVGDHETRDDGSYTRRTCRAIIITNTVTPEVPCMGKGNWQKLDRVALMVYSVYSNKPGGMLMGEGAAVTGAVTEAEAKAKSLTECHNARLQTSQYKQQ